MRVNFLRAKLPNPASIITKKMQQNAFFDEKCPISEHFLLVKGFFLKMMKNPETTRGNRGREYAW
jgi:hypothetical protein